MRTFIAISRSLLTASAVVAALQLASPAYAQYQPYGYGQQAQPQAPPQYNQTGVYQGYSARRRLRGSLQCASAWPWAISRKAYRLNNRPNLPRSRRLPNR